MSYVAVGGMAISLATSLIGAGSAKKQAEKQREQTWNLGVAQMETNQQVSYEQIRTTSETERIRILSDSLEKYREALQKESTIRLRDTWIYVAGLGCGTGVIYGIFLMYSKSGSNAN